VAVSRPEVSTCFKWTLDEWVYAAWEDSVWSEAATFQGSSSWMRLIG
jgi:hypothetical protein